MKLLPGFLIQTVISDLVSLFIIASNSKNVQWHGCGPPQEEENLMGT
jgi:hypothetical protein